MEKSAVLIAGPTASGKSALALRLARERDAVIVNADALQVYAGLRLITARPSAADEAAAPHRLYGVVDPATRFSTGDWARAVASLLAELGDQPVIFVGGTGLYFEALTNGFAEVPPIPEAAIAAATAEVAPLDRAGRERLIRARDPLIADRLEAADPQRVIRALAVLAATGQSLARFQDASGGGLLGGYAIERMVLLPEREILRERIAQRFATMLEQGAIDEVRSFLGRGLDPSLPAMKAIGLREIGGFLSGEIDAATMSTLAVTATRQYAKRQRTWFRNRMSDWPVVS